MDQAGIIRDLLIWLEGHLDQPLSLDNVAAKAGYSKWHLQRMFKDVTGHAIGAYIRARRLSKSAVALRLTARPILDIALQYRFDSQQTFTRAFKKQFSPDASAVSSLLGMERLWHSPAITAGRVYRAGTSVRYAGRYATPWRHAELFLLAGTDFRLPPRNARAILA